METLARKALAAALPSPVVFVANMHFTAYDTYGSKPYQYVKTMLTQNQCFPVMLAHSTAHNSTIDSRARTLYRRVERVLLFL